MSQKYHLVARNEQMEQLLDEISLHETIALDTEADSLHHYREKVCLIQLGVGERQWIVDPLATLDLDPLMRLLERRELLLHGADYDLRLLYRSHNFKPDRIFDTMLAAQLLGRARIGLAALVEEFFGVILPKKGQKADWSHRPLTEELLEYAADDTRYLPNTAGRLRAELEAKGRLDWHGESCRRQIAAARQARAESDDEAWRVKGARQMSGRGGAVLREVWLWREEMARKADRPPFKIASNEFLVHWAQWAAENPRAGIGEAPEPPPWLVGSRLRTFHAALEHALALPPEEWPAPPVPRESYRRSQEEERLLTRVLKARDEIAAQLEMDPGVLGSREALREVVRRRARNAAEVTAAATLMDWQVAALAAAVLPVLHQAGAPEGVDGVGALDETALGEADASGIE